MVGLCGSEGAELSARSLATRADERVDPAIDIDAIYRDHAQFLARVIARLTGDDASVDDLLQESFIAAFRKQHTYDGTAAIRTWLYGIASRLALQHRRSQRRGGLFRQRLQAEPLTPSSSPLQVVERTQNRARLYHALQSIPDAHREVVVLYELEGLEGVQVSEMLGIPEGTVWTRLHHGRKKLLAALQRDRSAEGRP